MTISMYELDEENKNKFCGGIIISSSEFVANVIYEAIRCKSYPTLPRHIHKLADDVRDVFEAECESIGTHRMGEGIIRRFRRCVKCGLEEIEEIEECFSDTGKTSEPTKIEELKESEFYTEGAIISKLNEVIRIINKEL